VVVLVIAGLLAGCSAGGIGAAAHAAKTSEAATASATALPSTPAPPSALASPTAPVAGANQGLLGALPPPAGANPWSTNTNALIPRVDFIQTFYPKSVWSQEEGLYVRRGFVSAVIEGWINTDGSQQSITIARFASPAGATSAYYDLRARWKQKAKPMTMLTYPAIGAAGWSNPTLDNLGNTRVEFAVAVGDYLVRVQEYTAVTTDPAAAEALLLEQYDALKNGS
jgi:hypothetical protein